MFTQFYDTLTCPEQHGSLRSIPRRALCYWRNLLPNISTRRPIESAWVPLDILPAFSRRDGDTSSLLVPPLLAGSSLLQLRKTSYPVLLSWAASRQRLLLKMQTLTKRREGCSGKPHIRPEDPLSPTHTFCGIAVSKRWVAGRCAPTPTMSLFRNTWSRSS